MSPCQKYRRVLSSIVDLGNERSMQLPFVALKPRTLTLSETTSSDGGGDHGSASEDRSSSSELLTYQRYSSLEQDIQCGKHKRALEQETLLDRAMLKYAYELEKGGSKVEELWDVACSRKETVRNRPLPMGWALESSFTRKTRFNSTQKDYLQKKFEIGEKSGRKFDPVTVSQEMQIAKDSSGNRLFSSSEFLTWQ